MLSLKSKDFKKNLVLILSILVFIFGISSCAMPVRKSQAVLEKGAEKKGIYGYLVSLLSYASLAPSSYNTQPWKIKVVSDSEIIVQADQSRWLSRVDPDAREVLLSLGAFWENLEQAAVTLGIRTDAQIICLVGQDTDILRIKFSKGYAEENNSLKLMQIRATNRYIFKIKDIESGDLDKIKELLPDNLVYFSRNTQSGEWIARSLIEAKKKQVFNDEKQKETSEWLRFKVNLANKTNDGLTPLALGLGRRERFLWYNFKTQESALSKSFRNKAVNNITRQVNNCSGFVIIASIDNSPTSLLAAGRELERLELKCTELGIVFQPMSEILEESPWKDDIAQVLGLRRKVQFVVRIGYPVKPAKVSLRRPVAEFINLR